MSIRRRQDTGHYQIDFRDVKGNRYVKALKRFPLETWIGRPVIYLLMNLDECLYVGQTINLPARIQHHIKRYNGNRCVFNSVFYIDVPKKDLNRIETEIIQNLKPTLNRTGVPKKRRYKNRIGNNVGNNQS